MSTPRLVADIRPAISSSSPRQLTAIGSILYFSANDGISGFELWKTDGTSSGTTQVADIRPGISSSYPGNFTAIDNTIYFIANYGIRGFELWKTGGTSDGTSLVADINTNNSSYGPSSLIATENTIYFVHNDGTSGYELWKTDGSITTLVADINRGIGNSDPRELMVIENTLFFTASDGIGGRDLWRTDGTNAGISRLTDFDAIPLFSSSVGRANPQSLTRVGNTLFFVGWGESSEFALWKSDGTPAGTNRIIDFQLGVYESGALQLAGVGETLFFTAFDEYSGRELWKTDGTALGTQRITDIRQGPYSSGISQLTAVGNTLFFTANDGISGTELWKTDGTSAGTQRVADINLGIADSNPSNLTAVGNSLFFTAFDRSNGHELWRTDGTTSGAIRITDTGSAFAASPGYPALVGNTLFFTAELDGNGNELWALDIDTDPDGETGSTYSINRLFGRDGREGESLLFRITRTGEIGQAGSVKVATKSGGATADVDFRSLNTTIDFAPGQATVDVSVDALWDLETEGTETFSIDISTNSSRDRIGTASVSGLINSVQASYAGVDKDGQPFVIKDTDYNPAWMVSFRGANKPFNFRRPTYVYIHGWKDKADSSNSKIIYEALSSRGANVINVDWSMMAAINSVLQPTKAVTATQQVGETVADFLIKTGLPLTSVTLIGHSLGSLVAASAAREIKSRTGKPIAELVALDTAFGDYDIDGRTSRIDRPLAFNTVLAATTTSFTVSDLVGGIFSLAGSNGRASTADNAYLVQYARSLDDDIKDLGLVERGVGPHNGVIGVYSDLFRKQALSPDSIPIRQTFDAEGRPDTKGKFDGVVVAPLPWSYSKGEAPQRRAPKAIGWATSYDDPVIYGSNTDDVMFFDLFRDERNSVTLHGRGGNDWLIANQTDKKGVDSLIGGKGADTFWFGYERYGKKTLPYMNTLADTTGYGGNAYGVVADFEHRSDSLLFGWKSGQIKARAGSAISKDLVSAHGNGMGFMRGNDLITYVPGLRASHITGLQDSGRLGYQQFAPLEEALFF